MPHITARVANMAGIEIIHSFIKHYRNYGVHICPSAQYNSSSGVNNSSFRTKKNSFLGPAMPTH